MAYYASRFQKGKCSRNLAKHCPTCHRQEILYAIVWYRARPPGFEKNSTYVSTNLRIFLDSAHVTTRVHALMSKMFRYVSHLHHSVFLSETSPNAARFHELLSCEPIPSFHGNFLPQPEGDNVGGRSYAVLLTWCIGIGGCSGLLYTGRESIKNKPNAKYDRISKPCKVTSRGGCVEKRSNLDLCFRESEVPAYSSTFLLLYLPHNNLNKIIPPPHPQIIQQSTNITL